MRRRLGLGAALGLGAVLLVAAPAQAHNYLVSSTPEAGSTVTTLPETIGVTTNGPLLDLDGDGGGFGLAVQDSSGTYYGDGCLTIDGATLSTDAALGAPGAYTVTWQVVSTDAHPVSKTFTFEWAPTDTTQESAGTATPPDCNGTRPVETAPPEVTASGATLDPSVLWIGGAILAVIVAVGVTLLLVRPRKRE
jgi:methionine-rich copper-binding protein CopC